ncbi:MAG: HAMP domain-containing protein [Alphaproteobacteria bacterium]|nr:HAMP domain-containing protein [Alphaproteobacteria bacterium]
MFSIKQFLPRTLFGRSVMIIVTPLVLLQVVSTWVFYDRHWNTVTRRLASAVAGEISSVIDNRRNFPGEENQSWVFYSAGANLGLRINVRKDDILPNSPRTTGTSTLDKLLGNALRERVRRPFHMDTFSHEREVRIQVQLPDGVMDIVVDRERLFSSTTYIFVMWMVGTSLLLFAIATIFMRNQVRPIRRLAAAVDNFGKGRDDSDFKPEGSTEIRQAAAAFNLMRERIQRTINQRTEMLAGISHDLRTPLTRMKLQLAMVGDSPEIADLRSAVEEMEKMVEEYLAFARGESAEQVATTNVSAILRDIVNGARINDTPVSLASKDRIFIPLKPNGFKRAVTNLVNNAILYGGNVAVEVTEITGAVQITVDDDGPGIPMEEREDVFKPFYRLDSARSPDTGGSGLGLTIARDVVRAHGGDLTIEESPLGGARIRIRLPM